MKTSKYSGFFKLSVEDRMKEVAEFANLTEEDQKVLQDADSLDMDKADHMIENVIGRFALPLGVAINFQINGKDYVIPMVSEEPSVVAACTNAAKMARVGRWIYDTFFRNSYDFPDSASECSDTICSKEHDSGAQR